MTLAKMVGVLALSALPLAGPKGRPVHAAVKPQPLPIQTVPFNTWELPAYVEVTPLLGGLVYDVYMANGACTQSSMSSGTAARVAFQQPQYTQEIVAYGTYCFYVNAWDVNGNFLKATILTTVKVVQIAAPTGTTTINTASTASHYSDGLVVYDATSPGSQP